MSTLEERREARRRRRQQEELKNRTENKSRVNLKSCEKNDMNGLKSPTSYGEDFEEMPVKRRLEREQKFNEIVAGLTQFNGEDELERRRRERREARLRSGEIESTPAEEESSFTSRRNRRQQEEDSYEDTSSSRPRRRRGYDEEDSTPISAPAPTPAPAPAPVTQEDTSAEDTRRQKEEEERRQLEKERRRQEEEEEAQRQAEAEEERRRQEEEARRRRQEEERKRAEEERHRREEEERLEKERQEREHQVAEESARMAAEAEKKKKKGKRKGLGGLSPEKKKILKKLIMQKAAEDLKSEALAKALEKEQYINERVEPLTLDGLDGDGLKKLCKALHAKVAQLEEEVYDWEFKIRRQETEINELTLKVNDSRGKFVKPVLRKVNKTESKFDKLKKEKEKSDFRSTLKSHKDEEDEAREAAAE